MDTSGRPNLSPVKYRHNLPFFFFSRPIMALSIAVHPLTPTLDMYGESDSRYALLRVRLGYFLFLIHTFSSAAYSLSGHVSISVSQTTARLLLQSISLTFEGQSEVLTPCTGYSGLRLCSVTRELAPKPTELSNEDSGETCMSPIHLQFFKKKHL